MLGPPTEPGLGPLSDTERAVFGADTAEEVHALLDAHLRRNLGSGIARVRFRAGRIDAVWGLDLDDGRAVVIKTHRPPVDTTALGVVVDALRLLSATGYPCPTPLAGPDEVGGHVVTVQTLLTGELPDGRDPATRPLLARGLAEHIEILRHHRGLVSRAGSGPSWCRYQDGPWPVPHDTLVDFTVTVEGFGWLDRFGRRAADQVLAHRDADAVVVGHADWYAGNVVLADGALTGTFDWELVADTEAVIAGFAAACYRQRGTSAGGLSSPEQVADFLRDYDGARGEPLTTAEQRTAAAAAAWICAFNARWQVALLAHDLSDDFAHVLRLEQRQDAYLSLGW